MSWNRDIDVSARLSDVWPSTPRNPIVLRWGVLQSLAYTHAINMLGHSGCLLLACGGGFLTDLGSVCVDGTDLKPTVRWLVHHWGDAIQRGKG